jgi:D-alanyl-lipoteichoic acid acyltransferase DltB (MBOAT superfamily)
MSFNSCQFLFVFLPITVIVYYALGRRGNLLASTIWLMIVSLAYYAMISMEALPLLVVSITINFLLGRLLHMNRTRPFSQKVILFVGLFFNILLLGYYKYVNGVMVMVSDIFRQSLESHSLMVPVGLSFFTIIQIAFLVDVYRRKTEERNFLSYFTFVAFFPYICAGPIVRHEEVTKQLNDPERGVPDYKNLTLGTYLFFLGLFKKVVLADNFAVFADMGFANPPTITFAEGWATSLSYTFQIYFDFSGYTDMAIGCALMLDIRLPANFNSPYGAVGVKDFWRKWHMTLGRFLRDYIYIPLGGNRGGIFGVYGNIMITFLICGIWHGAGWTFILWGFLHGIALVAERGWERLGLRLNRKLAWFLTFNFINVTWVFFRAPDLKSALSILKAMIGGNGVMVPESAGAIFPFLNSWGVTFGNALGAIVTDQTMNSLLMLGPAVVLLIIAGISRRLTPEFVPSAKAFFITVALILVSITTLLAGGKEKEFVYFTF